MESIIKIHMVIRRSVIPLLFIGGLAFADDPKPYVNKDYKFSFMVPAEWKLYGEQKGEQGVIVGSEVIHMLLETMSSLKTRSEPKDLNTIAE